MARTTRILSHNKCLWSASKTEATTAAVSISDATRKVWTTSKAEAEAETSSSAHHVLPSKSILDHSHGGNSISLVKEKFTVIFRHSRCKYFSDCLRLSPISEVVTAIATMKVALGVESAVTVTIAHGQ